MNYYTAYFEFGTDFFFQGVHGELFEAEDDKQALTKAKKIANALSRFLQLKFPNANKRATYCWIDSIESHKTGELVFCIDDE